MAQSKQETIELAQRTANREGKPMAVLNLNAFSPIYVVRDWHDRFTGELVVRIDPIQRKPISEEQAKAMTEARRLAKNAVREQWKSKRIKLSHYDPWVLTQAAMTYLAEHPELIEKAKLSLCKS